MSFEVFYLEELDITQQLATEATMAGEATTISADTTIEKSISLSDAKAVFKCEFPGNTLTNEPTGIFTENDTFLSVFATVTASDALGFVDGLVTEMTGASGASDVLDNESEVKENVETKIGTGITAIESGIIDGVDKGPAACVGLFKQIKEADPGRFQLTSSVPATTADDDFGADDDGPVSYTNCLVAATGSGAGAVVTAFNYTNSELTLTGNSGATTAYTNGDVLLFIHSVTGTGFYVEIDTIEASNLNGNGSTATLSMEEITEADITNETTFSLFKKINSGSDTTDVTPAVRPDGSLTLTIEHDSTRITDTTITIANTAGQSDFSDGDVIVAYTKNATPDAENVTPKAIVLTLNTITAAYLNNDLANGDGVSMPLIPTDKLDFKVSIQSSAAQKDASGVTITYTHSYALRGKLDLA